MNPVMALVVLLLVCAVGFFVLILMRMDNKRLNEERHRNAETMDRNATRAPRARRPSPEGVADQRPRSRNSSPE